MEMKFFFAPGGFSLDVRQQTLAWSIASKPCFHRKTLSAATGLLALTRFQMATACWSWT
jgi:hypothetical protein